MAFTEDGEPVTVTGDVLSAPDVTEAAVLIKKLVVVATPKPLTEPLRIAVVAVMFVASVVVTS